MIIMTTLRKIRSGGRLLETLVEIKNEVVRFFKDLYKSENVIKSKLDGVYFPLIPHDVKIWLDREFEEEEVSRVLEECNGDKALGPNGFNFSFIKANWDVVKEDVGNLLLEFHKRGRIKKEMNATCLTLIPKVPTLVELRDYRPISLVDCLYKLMAKILVNRLKSVIYY